MTESDGGKVKPMKRLARQKENEKWKKLCSDVKFGSKEVAVSVVKQMRGEKMHLSAEN